MEFGDGLQLLVSPAILQMKLSILFSLGRRSASNPSSQVHFATPFASLRYCSGQNSGLSVKEGDI